MQPDKTIDVALFMHIDLGLRQLRLHHLQLPRQ